MFDYDKDADTLYGGFKFTPEEFQEVKNKFYLDGLTSGEILHNICTDELLDDRTRYALLVHFGGIFTLNEIDNMAKQHEEYAKSLKAAITDGN